MSQVIARTMDQEAVEHARVSEHASDLAWAHLRAEYTQDIEKVLATLSADVPLTWTLPELSDDGSIKYLVGQDLEEIRHEYIKMREFVEIHDWRALIEIRQGWYTLTHGVIKLMMKETGEFTRNETVTMFPTGPGGILGEVQIGAIRHKPDLSGAPMASDGTPLPQRRLEAFDFHNAYIDALRTENVEAIVAAHRDNGASAIRNYLTEKSSVLIADSAAELGEYYTDFYKRYRVRDLQFVNRVIESWFVFAELHWMVEERSGAGRTLEFCTAETSPLDPEGLYWVRTGIGTEMVEV